MALPTGEYTFGATLYIKQKQVNRPSPLKQNRKHEELKWPLSFSMFYHIAYFILFCSVLWYPGDGYTSVPGGAD